MNSKKFSLVIRKPINNFKKKITVDSDKSISIRSFLLGSISNGVSSVKNVLESEDVFSTITCLRKLNIKVFYQGNKTYKIFGKGLGSYKAKKMLKLNFGNSGTLARLIIGIITSTPNIKLKILGDKSLNKRSMKKLIDLMTKFGAEFFPKGKFFFPLTFSSTNYPIGISYNSGTSAQLKSAVILAGLNSYGDTEITENFESRDHTENMLMKNKRAIKITKSTTKKIKIFGKQYLDNFSINVPGDPSSAAFFTALTLLQNKSILKIKNVCLNQTRTGFYYLLKKHGAKINYKNLKKQNNEVRGDILIKNSKLRPIKANKSYYSKATDEYPIMFVMAALIKGTSVFEGIKDLANKESNRIIEMQKILKQIGVKSISSKNSLKIYGKGIFKAKNKKIFVPNLGDHRICMSAFVLALLTGASTSIKNFETVNTSSPSFLKIMKNLGAKFEKR